MNIEIDLDIPVVPNFILVRGGDAKYSIADIPEETLAKLGEAWVTALIMKARQQRVSVKP